MENKTKNQLEIINVVVVVVVVVSHLNPTAGQRPLPISSSPFCLVLIWSRYLMSSYLISPSFFTFAPIAMTDSGPIRKRT